MDKRKIATELVRIAKSLVAKKPVAALSVACDALHKAESELNSMIGSKDIVSASDMKKIVSFRGQVKNMARDLNRIKETLK